MKPDYMNSIETFNKENLMKTTTVVHNNHIVVEDINSSTPPVSELTHRVPKQATPAITATMPPISQSANTTEGLLLMGFLGGIMLVNEYYGLPGVLATLALIKGAASLAERSGWVKPAQAHRAAGYADAGVALGCFFSACAQDNLPSIGACVAGGAVALAASKDAETAEITARLTTARP